MRFRRWASQHAKCPCSQPPMRPPAATEAYLPAQACARSAPRHGCRNEAAVALCCLRNVANVAAFGHPGIRMMDNIPMRSGKHGQTPPGQCPSLARAPPQRRLAALGDSTLPGERGPPGDQPLPRVFDLAASKVADSTAVTRAATSTNSSIRSMPTAAARSRTRS